MLVRLVCKHDLDKWLTMRQDLWPECPRDEHIKEMNEALNYLEDSPVFVVENNNEIIGFVETSIHEYAPGCHTTPIGYIEGWYVDSCYRKTGVGKLLLNAVETWALLKGFKEVGSDAEIQNQISILAHRKLGYHIVGKSDVEVKFIKSIDIQEVYSTKRIENVHYKLRQSSYGIIFNHKNELALIQLTKGLYMPGGGMEGLENFKECIQRELLEEIGHDCEVKEFICKSTEYFYSKHTSDFRVFEGYFYRVILKDKVIEPIEENHVLVWVNLDYAIEHLIPRFQKEALKYYQKLLD